MNNNEDFLFDYESECQIISALIFNIDDRSLILSKLKVKNFYDQTNRIIFKTIYELISKNIEIDPVTIKNYIIASDYDNKDEVIKMIDLGVYNYGFIDNLEQKIKIVINKSIKRDIDNFANNIINEKIDPSNPNEQFNAWSNELNQIIDAQELDELDHINSAIDTYRDKLINSINNDENELTGISSGYEDIDTYTNGFQRGDLIVLAARPSVGKTALAINFILNAAKTLTNPNDAIVMFSLEMSKEQIIQRMLCNVSSIDSYQLKKSKIDERYLATITSNSELLAKLPIYIDDNPNTTTIGIEAKLRQFTKNHNIQLVVIDYLQLISNSSNSNTNRVNEVAKISRHLKNIARDLNIPIIAIAQLSRKIEERKFEDRKPMLSDLRESGSIEQDADLVTFIDIDYSVMQQNGDKLKLNKDLQNYKSNDPFMIFYIEKHRNGLTGSVRLRFNKKSGQFISVNSSATKGYN